MMKHKWIAILFLFLAIGNAYAEIGESQAFDIAQKVYDEVVPSEVKNEYKFRYVVTPTYDATKYRVVWSRYVNGIQVSGDLLWVYVDKGTGAISHKHFSYGYPATEIDTTPTMTKAQALQIALDAYGGTHTTAEAENPFLSIRGKDLLWMVSLQFGRGRLWLGLDADTGETMVFSPDRGLSIKQVPTHFEPPWYQPILLNSTYIVITLVAVIGIVAFFRRDKIQALIKR